MLLQDCSWMDVEARIRTDQRIVLVLGATEQHSDLSLCTDTSIPFEIAKEACAAENVLLAPPIPFGISEWSMAYPGTISLRTPTLCAVVSDVMRSLCSSGFRRFFVLNGHGFNRAVSPVFGEALEEFDDGSVQFFQWWELDGVREAASGVGAYGHANWAEAFPFTILRGKRTVTPSTGKAPNLLQSPRTIRAQMGMGHGSGPVSCDEAVTAAMFSAAVRSFRAALSTP